MTGQSLFCTLYTNLIVMLSPSKLANKGFTFWTVCIKVTEQLTELGWMGMIRASFSLSAKAELPVTSTLNII